MDVKDAYNSAREENLVRFRLRDQAINMYLAFIGTIIAGEIVILSKAFNFGAAGNGESYVYLTPLLYVHVLLCLSVIPFVHVYGHHDMIIGYIHHFIKYELLGKIKFENPDLVTWDSSETLKESSTSLKNFRGSGIYYLFTLPVLISYLILSFTFYQLTASAIANPDEFVLAKHYIAIPVVAAVSTIASYLYTSKKLRDLINVRKSLV